MVFYSDEKERVIPLLVNIMHYVVPYLRNHRYLYIVFNLCRSLPPIEIWYVFDTSVEISMIKIRYVLKLLLYIKFYSFLLTFFFFSAHNASSYRACVQLLSSLSGYQYTRRAWKKEAFDLFMDSSFFQMDASCVNQ